MCSSSKDLYIASIEYLRYRFRETKCLHYCTLRAEIIMYLHEMDSTLFRQDPTDKSAIGMRKVRRNESVLICDEKPHRVAWCADALLRNIGNVNNSTEIEIRKFQEL